MQSDALWETLRRIASDRLIHEARKKYTSEICGVMRITSATHRMLRQRTKMSTLLWRRSDIEVFFEGFEIFLFGFVLVS